MTAARCLPDCDAFAAAVDQPSCDARYVITPTPLTCRAVLACVPRTTTFISLQLSNNVDNSSDNVNSLPIRHFQNSSSSSSSRPNNNESRVRPKFSFGFGFGYGAETDLTYGFGLVSATAKVHWHKFGFYAETVKLAVKQLD